jgi:hypothetical protein
MQIKTFGHFTWIFMESCFNYENLFITVQYDCFELLKLYKVGLNHFGIKIEKGVK